MVPILTSLKYYLGANTIKAFVLIISIGLITNSIDCRSQSFCSTSQSHGNSGYISSIESVSINSDNNYSIVLRVEHNGCSDQQCKALNQYSIEADQGTYSDISYYTVYGNMSSNGINMGPNLGGTPFDGFRIASISGIGNGQAGVFHVTYTLTYLQDQQVQVKAAGLNEIISFTLQDFTDVLNCKVGGAYAMPQGGKIGDLNDKIGPELTALSNFSGVPLTNEVYKIIHDQPTNIFYVVTEFISETGQYNSLLNELVSNYGLREEIGDNVSIITGEFPIGELQYLNDLVSLSWARPVYPATTNVGLSTSQGDTSMISHIARDIFSVHTGDTRRFINGEGIKVGVMSNSFDTKTDPPNQANDDVLKWDLPGTGIKADGSTKPNPYNDTDIINLKDYPYGEASDEGRAMMQIIHDIAPGADLYFRTGVLGAVDMSNGIDELVNAGCDVIVDDITYISQPFYEDGTLAQKVNEVVNDANNPISYFTSAGNFGNKSYSASFSGGTSIISGIDGTPHVFGVNNGVEDIYQGITADLTNVPNPPANFTIVLQWEDGSSFNSTNTDLDIYLASDNGNLIGYNTVNTGGKAIEVLPFVVTESTTANIVIVKASDNTADINFKYVVFNGPLIIDEYASGDATIVGHANSSGAMTVGAIRYDKTPAYGGNLDIMSYSSRGGHQVNGADRNKPDFTAPNGVNTTVNLGNGDWDHNTDPEADTDTYPNFFGTSASAPHAAAVAALMMDANNMYYNAPLLPGSVRNNLIATAIGNGSYDNTYGNGFIQADQALWLLGNPAPILNEIISIIGTPGIEEVQITVSADYITTNTKLFFLGQELTTIVDTDNGTLTSSIPSFTELYPPIEAYNPPMEGTFGNDGGMSNTLYFTEKPTIVGTLSSVSKTYGENIPNNPITYEVAYIDGTTLPLENAGLSTEQITRVQAIQILNNADALSNAGVWPYYVDPHDWLNPNYIAPNPVIDKTDIELDLLANFNFSFNIGELNVLKLELMITPEDKTIIYGEEITGLNYIFSYDSSAMTSTNYQIIQDSLNLAYMGDLISDRTALVDSAFYMADSMGGLVPNSYFMSADAYANGLALALVNGKALALVNRQALALVNGNALALVNNLDSLATVNGKALALVNGKALALVNRQALALVNTEHLTNGLALALVNRQALALVNTELETEAFVNGKALALVNRDVITNRQALALVNNGQNQGLVNRQALALVNSTSLNEVTNTNAIIILTVDDIKTMESGTPMDEIELISINTISGNEVTTGTGAHKISPGAFNASNFNVNYGLGDLTVDPAPILFTLNNLYATYDGNEHNATVNASYPTITPETQPYQLLYYDVNGNVLSGAPINAGTYTAVINITNPNFSIDSLGQSQAQMIIAPAPVTFNFTNLVQTYDGNELYADVSISYPATPFPELTDYNVYYNNAENLPVDAGSYNITISINDGNYNFADPSNPPQAEFIINPAPVTFDFTNLIQTYNGNGLFVETTINYPSEPYPILTDYTLFYNGVVELPIDAGTYTVTVLINDGNYTHADPTNPSQGELLINPAPVTFNITNLAQIYNGNNLSADITISYPDDPYPPLTDYTVYYNNSTELPVNVNTYLVTIVIDDGNYTYADPNNLPQAEFIVYPAPVTFSFSDVTQTYCGAELSIGITITYPADPYPALTDYTVLYNNNSALPVDANTYPVSIEINDGNYAFSDPSNPPQTEFVIVPVDLEVTIDYQSKLYGETDPDFTYQVTSGQLVEGDYITGSPVREAGEDVGVYTIYTDDGFTAGNNYTINSINNVLDINPAVVYLNFSNTSSTYNGYPQGVTVTTVPDNVNYNLVYYLNGTSLTGQPVNAGLYQVDAIIIDPNYTNSGQASIDFDIVKADLEAVADDHIINEGEPAPVFTFTFNTFLGSDDVISVFGSDPPPYSIPYNTSSGPGEYMVSLPSVLNYNIILPADDPGIFLFVNPDGPGTKAVVPKLDCVTHDGQGNYTAHYEYENKNNVPVWVFIGVDNLVTGGGSPDLSQQPIKFESGGGTWSATFDGSQMSWEVSSQHHGHKATHAQNASSNSRNCNKSGFVESFDESDNNLIKIYPNPVKGLLTVEVDDGGVIRDISLINMFGKRSDVNIERISDEKNSIDMNGLLKGIYIVKIHLDNELLYYKVIKQ